MASYNGNEESPHEPDGVALVWNMKYKKESPEFIFHCQVKYKGHICDTIKRNESDVGDIGFEIFAKTVFQFLCFILFLALTNSS